MGGRADADDDRDPKQPRPELARTRTRARSPMSAPGNGECARPSVTRSREYSVEYSVGTSTFLGNVAENMTVCRSGRAFCGNGSIYSPSQRIVANCSAYIARCSESWPKLEHASPFQPASHVCT